MISDLLPESSFATSSAVRRPRLATGSPSIRCMFPSFCVAVSLIGGEGGGERRSYIVAGID